MKRYEVEQFESGYCYIKDLYVEKNISAPVKKYWGQGRRRDKPFKDIKKAMPVFNSLYSHIEV